MKPIWHPLFTVIVLGLMLYVAWRNYPWWNENSCDSGQVEKYTTPVIACLITLLAWGAAMGIACAIDSVIADHSEQEWGECWKANMVSLRGADGISGSISGGIFMLSGHVGSEQFYHYYTVADDGSFKPHKWKAGSTTRVYEEDRKDGQVVQWDKHFKRTWISWFAEPSDSVAMDFHIPKGSLKQNFSLE
jgi:hypothetical protein